MEETVDGEYQAYKANDGAYVREHFFGKDPKTLEMVSRMSDEAIWRLNRGGHDPNKVYAAFDAAMKTVGQPTVILAKTIKGYGLGHVAQAKIQLINRKNLVLRMCVGLEIDLTYQSQMIKSMMYLISNHLKIRLK